MTEKDRKQILAEVYVRPALDLSLAQTGPVCPSFGTDTEQSDSRVTETPKYCPTCPEDQGSQE